MRFNLPIHLKVGNLTLNCETLIKRSHQQQQLDLRLPQFQNVTRAISRSKLEHLSTKLHELARKLQPHSKQDTQTVVS